MSKAALIILFNHNYEANLSRLDEIYKNRFEDVYYIMPFYTGNRKDIITVYESSFYFQGFIAKALDQIKDQKYEHYIVIGDDVLLHPVISDANYKNYFQIDADMAFIPGMFLLNDIHETRPNRPMAPFWPWLLKAIDFRIDQEGTEVKNFLPTYEEALAKLKHHGYHFTPEVSTGMFYYRNYFKRTTKENVLYKKVYKQLLPKIALTVAKRRKIPYPLVGSYSDCVVIPHKYVNPVIRYYGIFAALNLFVEIALPTGLALAVPKIISEETMDFKGHTYWTPEDFASFEEQYQHSLAYLLTNFPGEALYIHPVKLSKWK
ncbi:MAG TPA: hypothetical protein VM935_05245 [Chitinophagaceae bacterium]|nr:hypothetical protein [Chitinophagaceae bacterium]